MAPPSAAQSLLSAAAMAAASNQQASILGAEKFGRAPTLPTSLPGKCCFGVWFCVLVLFDCVFLGKDFFEA
jgi:hypothetical protein